MAHTARFFLLSIFVFLTGAGQLSAQIGTATKQNEWAQIQQMADKAFALKDQEARLSNQLLEFKVRERMRSFQETVHLLTPWIDKYFPTGKTHPTTAFVHAIFLQTLYLEYAGYYQLVYKAYSSYLPALLGVLELTHQAIPIYDKVPISYWVRKKSSVFASVNKELEARKDIFDFEILESADSELDKAMRRVDYMLKTSRYLSIVSSQSDQQFALKQIVLNVANSVAEKDPIKWSDVYISGLCKTFKLPLSKTTGNGFHLYSVRTDAGQKVTIALDQAEKNIKSKYSKARPLKELVIAIHGTVRDSSFTDSVFNSIFGQRESFQSINFDVERWNGRIIFVNTSLHSENTSLISNIQEQAAFSWLLNDWTGLHPPHWFIGIPFNNTSVDNIHLDSFRLLFLKATLEHDKFPLIESFINMTHDSKPSDVIFIKGYWEYFWRFFEKKGLADKLYNSARNIKLKGKDATNMEWAKLLTNVTSETLEDLNKEFIQFVQSRKVENIQQNNNHWELAAKDFIFSQENTN